MMTAVSHSGQYDNEKLKIKKKRKKKDVLKSVVNHLSATNPLEKKINGFSIEINAMVRRNGIYF